MSKTFSGIRWCGSTASRLQPPWGGSLLFMIQFPEISGTHFIDLGRMKGWLDLRATQWFWTRDPQSSTLTTRSGSGISLVTFVIMESSHIWSVMMLCKRVGEGKNHSMHWGINPTQKKHHPLFLAKPHLDEQTVQAPPF